MHWQVWFKSNHRYIKALVVYFGGYSFKHFFSDRDILMLSRSSVNWRQRSDITISVDLDAKPHIGQTKKKKKKKKKPHIQAYLFKVFESPSKLYSDL